MKLILNKDFSHSPYTGWTRETWVSLAEGMIAALQPWYTEGKGGLAFPQPYRQVESSLHQDERVRASFYAMEGWTRTRPLVAAWLMGTGQDVIRIEDRDVDLRQDFIQGFLSVSDPGSQDYISDRFGRNQWIPEVSIAAYGLWLAREKAWDPLPPARKDQIAAWLRSSVDPKYQIPDNNWHLFQVLTGHILGDLGCDYDKQLCRDRYARAEAFYLDEGWYIDGLFEKLGFAVEQYNPWMFHFYLPALAQISSGLEPRRKDEIARRLRAFLEAYQDFFAANGGFPMWGRSWFYKPGILIPFILAEILGCSPLSHGRSRRLVSGYMNYLIENNYFDQNMLPIMGYLTENHGLIDYYSLKGSAYWGSSVFTCLLMPEGHPFWAAPEEPLRVEMESYTRNITPVGLQVIGDKATGQTQVLNHRVWHANDQPHTRYGAKYAKFCYSSHFGIDVKRGEDGYGPDGMIQVSPDGRKFSHRLAPHFGALDEQTGLSWHYPLQGEPSTAYPFASGDASVKITTRIYAKGACLVRAHLIETAAPLAAFREGGYAVDFARDTVPEVIVGPDYAAVWNGTKGAFIRSLHGFSGARSREEILAEVEGENTHGDRAATPVITGGEIMPGSIIAASLSGTFFTRESLDSLLRLVTDVSVAGRRMTVRFADGTEKTLGF